MSYASKLIAVGSWAALTALATTGAYAICPTMKGKDPTAFVEALKNGGYILVFRHGDKYASTGEPHRPDNLGRVLPQACTNQDEAEVLNDNGVAQANTIKAGLGGVPIGTVFASTNCRTIETAVIAFGKSETLPVSLSTALKEPPEPGSNTVIVSHSTRIRTALMALDPNDDRTLSCGEAAVVDPTGNDGKPECVAQLLPNEWSLATAGNPPGWINSTECKTR